MVHSTRHALSIFDLDRTLTRRGTWSPFLLFAARRHAPWRLLLAPIAAILMLAYKAKLMSRTQLKQRMQAMMIGRRVSQTAIFDLAEAFADQIMESGVYAEGIDLIRIEQSEGRRVLIASAAHDFYLRSISRRLGVVDIVGTQSVWSNENLVAKVDGQNCYGDNKLSMIKAFMESRSLSRSETHIRFFSDDISDLPTFEWADEPVAVNPSAKLARYAARNGWCLFDWRQSDRRDLVPSLANETVKQAEISQGRLAYAVAVDNIG
jgi:HAD superfamily hydrolase (TIGR01490 family)